MTNEAAIAMEVGDLVQMIDAAKAAVLNGEFRSAAWRLADVLGDLELLAGTDAMGIGYPTGRGNKIDTAFQRAHK